MKLLMTGGTGVLARAVTPLLRDAGHDIDAPGSRDIDLFDPASVKAALDGTEAIMHLATRVPPPDAQGDPEAWELHDRLRSEATPILVDAALDAGVERFVFPSVAFMYPMTGPADETTPMAAPVPDYVRSALTAEQAVTRFADAGHQGVILRLGLLYGPGTGSDTPAELFAIHGSKTRAPRSPRRSPSPAGSTTSCATANGSPTASSDK